MRVAASVSSVSVSGEMTDGQALRADGGCEGTMSLFSLTHLGEEDDERKYRGKGRGHSRRVLVMTGQEFITGKAEYK